MKLLKKLFHFYVFSNLHVAIAGFSLTRITEISYGVTNYCASLFVGFSIILSYNFIRFFEIKTDRFVWFYNWFNANFIKIKLLVAFSIIGLLYIVLKGYVNLKSLYFIFPFGIMTFFYVIPLFKIGKIEVSFRNLPFIKIFSISIAWAGISSLFPIVNAGIELGITDFFEFIIRLFFVLAITIPFDIRDVNNDNDELKTIPQIFGIKGAKIIGLLSIIFIVIITYLLKRNISIDTIIVSILTVLFLVFSTPKRSIFYSSFWVESIPIVWLLLIVYFS
jgi:hypothetical protein